MWRIISKIHVCIGGNQKPVCVSVCPQKTANKECEDSGGLMKSVIPQVVPFKNHEIQKHPTEQPELIYCSFTQCNTNISE